ncbi:hypothetical protein [Brachyspira hyodysenteriae]|nr:hypothetical protein [Brachyspira hyodysenteriae]MCZ9967110.1 hypothetical protein [Brachyspira hyodysenteriae]
MKRIILWTRPDQTRPDQTRPDQTRPDQKNNYVNVCFAIQYMKLKSILY